MFCRARVLSSVASQVRASRTKSMALMKCSVPMSTKSLQVLRKPFAMLSGTFVVYAATSPQPPPKSTLSAKDVAELVKKADELFKDDKLEDILDLLRPFKDCGIEEIVWRISRAAFSLSKSKSISKSEKAEYVTEAYAMAKLTLELNENSALGHKWIAIALDAYNGLQGFRTRCSSLHAVKDHMVRSLEFDPSDATVIYMLGMMQYSIADLAWYERGILQAIVGKPLAASFEEALVYFRRAEETSPNFYSLNLLMLGKCLLKLGDKESAIPYLQRAKDYPTLTDEDHQTHQEAARILKKLNVS